MVAFKVLPLGSYAPMPAPSPPLQNNFGTGFVEWSSELPLYYSFAHFVVRSRMSTVHIIRKNWFKNSKIAVNWREVFRCVSRNIFRRYEAYLEAGGHPFRTLLWIKVSSTEEKIWNTYFRRIQASYAINLTWHVLCWNERLKIHPVFSIDILTDVSLVIVNKLG